ncbi:hypothetical protein FSPOR_7771 [Fusarium sporotrichioides]|uniref:Succinate dehydrogenase assembly factor 4, mitochondrial n=1 Tax=Fusarium sporotrichioides TaxID=5514 RepID=A0A395RXP4_FUSSP|nr:hypothetical protein FSPOR_7771 [Fusarium sporotrichioides]
MSRLLTRRFTPSLFRATTTPRFSSTFQSRPGPPKLPAEEQAEFERLQRAASVSSAFQPTQETAAAEATGATPATSQIKHTTTPEKKTDDEMNVGYFRGAPPEFEGDVNPKTGEVGGPKNEPLRWGGDSDWSYNGRATDF